MGRSVSYPDECITKCYRDVSEYEDEHDWDCFSEWIIEVGSDQWPSFEIEDNTWVGREDRVLLENSFAQIGVSEYCGLACVWLRSRKEDLLCHGYNDPTINLCDSWCHRISDRFEQLFGEYRLVARASNGEAFYEHIRKPHPLSNVI